VEYTQKLGSSYHSVAHRVKYFYCESRQRAGGMNYRDVTGPMFGAAGQRTPLPIDL
jgi:hypothetical protein